MVSGSNGTGGYSPEELGRANVVVPMPAFFKELLAQEAKAADKPVGPFLRDLLASARGITIPESAVRRRSKYASDEERRAAQKASMRVRSELIKQLIAEHRARQTEVAAVN